MPTSEPGSTSPWIEIESASDARISLFTGLTDVALRALREPAEGVFVAEGSTVLARAVDAGYEALSVLATPKWLRLLDLEHLLRTEVPRYCASDETMREITGYTVHRGVLVLMRRKPLPRPIDLMAGARRLVLLEDLKEHTNVGAIMRCAAAFGADGVITSPQCADPLYRRSVKVSMGTVFQVPWTTSPDWTVTLDELASVGFVAAALTPDEGAVDLRRWSQDAPEHVALLLGTEGPGLASSTLSRCEVKLRIPMSGGVDSLNVAAAAAVAMYALQPV